jgi:hypothetical protein
MICDSTFRDRRRLAGWEKTPEPALHHREAPCLHTQDTDRQRFGFINTSRLLLRA